MEVKLSNGDRKSMLAMMEEQKTLVRIIFDGY